MNVLKIEFLLVWIWIDSKKLMSFSFHLEIKLVINCLFFKVLHEFDIFSLNWWILVKRDGKTLITLLVIQVV